MENKNERWTKEKLEKYLKREAEREEIPEELEPEQMREWLSQKVSASKKHKDRKKKARYSWYAVPAACVSLILLALVSIHTLENARMGAEAPDSGVSDMAVETLDSKASKVESEQKLSYHEIYRKFSKVWELSDETEWVTEGSPLYMEFAGRSTASKEDAENEGKLADTESNADHSVTNVQEKGVEEADLIKNDGRYLYQAVRQERQGMDAGENRKCSVQIADTKNGLKEKARISGFENISEFYVWKDKLVVIEPRMTVAEGVSSYARAESLKGMDTAPAYWNRAYSKIHIYDIKNRAKPKEYHTFTVMGNYRDSRISDGFLYFFAQAPTKRPEKEEDYDDYIPVLDGKTLGAEDIFLPEEVQNASYLVMASVNMKKPDNFTDTKAVVTGAERFYVSGKNIYVTETVEPDYEKEGEQCSRTSICRVSYRSGKMKQEASGSVAGVLRDDMAMNEYRGYLRMAVTKEAYQVMVIRDDVTGEEIGYDISDSKMSNQLYVLGKNLKIMGKIENLAEGEEIYSARFLGDRGYFVTFRQTDPLFSADLSDPKKPKILGELKISGFSEYLHPYSKELLLGIGMEAEEETGMTQGLKLSMFDISNPKEVKEHSKKNLSDYDTSQALYDYKSVLIDTKKNLFGFLAEGYGEEDKCDYLVYSYRNGKFIQKMKIDCKEHMQDSWQIRGTYIKDSFYLLYGDGRIEEYRLSDGSRQSEIKL